MTIQTPGPADRADEMQLELSALWNCSANAYGAYFASLAAARDAGVRRLVLAGSSSVYGDALQLPKREDMPYKPLSPYALQKQVGEQYLQMFTALYGLETVTTRYFNVFGPRQDPGSP